MPDQARAVPCPVCMARTGAPCTSVRPSDWGGVTDGRSDVPMKRIHSERAKAYWAASRLREELNRK